ncbi:hypothetical protein [Kibdelosporangium philippinense]|uniref:hypothetical protein n=1 Tax=Kibdelosporangium philippinense TaxID=211113 RepID=UPI00360985ED
MAGFVGWKMVFGRREPGGLRRSRTGPLAGAGALPGLRPDTVPTGPIARIWPPIAPESLGQTGA